jgi:hypothetical protein
MTKYLAQNDVAAVPVDTHTLRGLVGTPTLVVVERDGRISHTWSGAMSSAQERELHDLLSGPS